jgi:hypothetical protein
MTNAEICNQQFGGLESILDDWSDQIYGHVTTSPA